MSCGNCSNAFCDGITQDTAGNWVCRLAPSNKLINKEADVSKRVTFKEANANLMNVNSLSVSECLEVFGIESQADLCLNCVHNTECLARRFYYVTICTCRFFIPVRCDKK